MTVPIVPLAELCEIVMGQSPPSVTYNVSGRGLPFFQGKAEFGDVFPHIRIFCSQPVRVAEKGDVLISVRAPVGPTNLAREKCCIGRGLSALRPSLKLNTSYLLYFLRYYEARLAQRGLGSTFSAINRDDLESIPIPLVSLSQQESTARRFEEAARLRRMRRYALQTCDELLPAVFLEMFGDFRISTSKYGLLELEDVADIVSGVTKGQRHNGRETVSVPYLRVANVQDGHLDLSEIKTITASIADARDLCLQPGDIVMTEGGDYDKLGRGAIWHGEVPGCIHQNHIFRVRLDQTRVLPVYFASLLRTPFTKEYFLRCAKQTTNLASINMTQLKATPVPIFPIQLQAHFASVVAQEIKLRAIHVEALRQADHLFQTLLHQAFSPQ